MSNDLGSMLFSYVANNTILSEMKEETKKREKECGEGERTLCFHK
jgi:hypothetical protein